MRNKLTQLLLSAILLFACHLATAQTPTFCPSTNTPAADLCPDMCIYCNLQEYTGATSGYSGQAPPLFCGTIENEQWLGFVAAATSATISATPSNCTNGNGVQVALYTSCTSDPVPGGCDMGFFGGEFYSPTITVSLTPGTTYYLMVDGWAGDQCDFTLSLSPPGAALQGQIITQQVPLCPGQTFTFEGMEYTAPGAVFDTLTNTGVCDSIIVYNLVPLPLVQVGQTVQFCPGESVVVNGIEFTEPGIYVYNITATSGGCDTVVTTQLEHLPQPLRTENLLLQAGEPVVIGGNTYFAPGTVLDTVPSASGGCDTLVTYLLLLDQTILDTCFVSTGFFKKIGEQGAFEIGTAICAAADENFYIAGEKGEESLLLKVTPAGQVLWSRQFRPLPPLATHITDLIEDSDGMLVGCGIVGEGDVNLRSHAFRYNPLTGSLLWSKILQQQSPEAFTILEKNPGGNFLLLASPQLALNVDDVEIWELNRNTGALVGGLTRRYNYGISDVFTSMVIHDGAIYATGRHIPTFGPVPPLGKMRTGLSKLDLATGIPVWSRLSHLDTSVTAFLHGEDLLIHDNAVLTVCSGVDSANIGAQQVFFLQKNTLDGELLWVKRYSLPGQLYGGAHDILRMSDGYVLIGNTSETPSEWTNFIVKTDFDGNVLWAKNLASSNVVNTGTSQFNTGRHSAVLVNDVLFFAGGTDDTDVLFLKMTSDGEAGDSCAFIESLNVQAESVPDPLNRSIPLQFIQNIGQLTNASMPTLPANMPVATYCVGCLQNCDDTLDLGPDIILCKDSTLTFNAGGNFVSYLWQDGSTDSTFTTNVIDVYWVEVTDACGDKQRDSVLLTVSLVGDIALPDTTLCAGESLTLTVPDFDMYLWSPATGLSCSNCATVTIQPAVTTVYTLFAQNEEGCSKLDAFTVTVLPLPTHSELVEFCPGESVTVGGNTYTQQGTVMDTIPSAFGGCDTIVTYTLQYITSPNSSVSIDCVEDINIGTAPGTGPIVVNYALPTVSSDCDCPGISLTLTQGLPSGSLFPVGTAQVCYQAKDSCGNTADCCFKVTVREEQPCDVKTIGCMKWELLTITKDAQNDFTYRIRATNSCTNKMIYTAIQVPDGILGVAPANNSIFTADSGRKYAVRNPNYSPFYSVRFKSQADSIANGQSDIFEYVIPGQTPPAYIHVAARLYPQVFYEAHLNTFYCPVGVTPNNRGAGSRSDFPSFKNLESLNNLTVFPNPTDGTLFADLSDWQGEQIQIQVFNSQGQRVQHLTVQASDVPQKIQLPESLASGLYFLEVATEKGEKRAARFVVQ